VKSFYEESRPRVTALALIALAPATSLWMTFQVDFSSKPWGANLKNKPSTSSKYLGTSYVSDTASQEGREKSRLQDRLTP
jgi:hypothetical protein